MRIALPVAVLAVGVVAFSILSVESDQAKSDPVEDKTIRTNVTEVRSGDYPVVIETRGIVQAHNEVALSAQVAGEIVFVSPTFEAGSYFEQDEVLVEIEAADYGTSLDIAEAQRLGAESALELARQDHERLSELYRSKNVAEAEVNQSAAALKQASAQLDSARAAVDQAQRDLKRTKIRAPFDGRVRQKLVGLGQTVSSGTALGVVFAVDFAEVRLPISDRERQFLDLPELPDDPPVAVQLRDAIRENDGTIWKASIVRTEGTLDQDSLELFAIARIIDPFGSKSNHPPLRIGQPVTASIAGRLLKNVVALPRLAIRQLDQIILVDKSELTLNSKTIEPIWSDEDYVIVRDPTLEDGMLLSTTKLVYAPDGAKVEIIPGIELTAATDTKSPMDVQPLNN